MRRFTVLAALVGSLISPAASLAIGYSWYEAVPASANASVTSQGLGTALQLACNSAQGTAMWDVTFRYQTDGGAASWAMDLGTTTAGQYLFASNSNVLSNVLTSGFINQGTIPNSGGFLMLDQGGVSGSASGAPASTYNLHTFRLTVAASAPTGAYDILGAVGPAEWGGNDDSGYEIVRYGPNTPRLGYSLGGAQGGGYETLPMITIQVSNPPPPPTGACCLPSFTCQQVSSQAACGLLGGTFLGLNVACASQCDPDVRLALVVLPASGPSDAVTTLPTSVASVETGQAFVAELWATDSGALNTGLIGVFASLSFTPTSMQATFVESRSPFTLLSGGTINNAGGTITGLGGNDATFAGQGIAPTWARVAVVHFVASCPVSSASLTLASSTNEVSARGRGTILPSAIQYGSATLNVVQDCAYDLTSDAFINSGDLGIFGASWLRATGNPGFNAACDFDCSGFVGAGDLGWFAVGWLRNCSTLVPTDYPPCRRCVTLRSPDSMASQEPVMLAWRAAAIPAQGDIAADGSLVWGGAGIYSAGQDVWLEIWATDSSATSRGLSAVYVDLAFGANPQLEVREIMNDAAFDVLASGQADASGIRRLGGGTLAAGHGLLGWTRVALVRCTARRPLPKGVSIGLTSSYDGVARLGEGTVAGPQIKVLPDLGAAIGN